MEINEDMWKEKTEHYHELLELEARESRLPPKSINSNFIHKDDIEWLLIKERSEAMLITFITTTVFWGFCWFIGLVFFG